MLLDTAQFNYLTKALNYLTYVQNIGLSVLRQVSWKESNATVHKYNGRPFKDLTYEEVR